MKIKAPIAKLHKKEQNVGVAPKKRKGSRKSVKSKKICKKR